MKTFILCCVVLFINSSVLYSQNVKFHEHMEEFKKEVKNIEDIMDDVPKQIKKAGGRSAAPEAKDDLVKASKEVEKANEEAENAKKSLKKAKKEAKAWGCEKTVEMAEDTEKALEELTGLIEEAGKALEKANKNDKLKKLQKSLDSITDPVKKVDNKVKSCLKEAVLLDESCS